jgi:hypothetical protein
LGLEPGHELTAAVDLDTPHGEGHALLQSVEDPDGKVGGGPAVKLEHIPAGYEVAGGELLQHGVRDGTHIEGVELDEVARPLHRVVLRFADGIGPPPGAFPGADSAGRLAEDPPPAQGGEDASHPGDGETDPLATEEHHQLGLAPAGVDLPEAGHGLHLGHRPGGPTPAQGDRAAILEAHQAMSLETAQPAVHGGPGEAEVAGREADVLAVGAVPVEHGKAGSGAGREVGGRVADQPIEGRRTGGEVGVSPPAAVRPRLGHR